VRETLVKDGIFSFQSVAPASSTLLKSRAVWVWLYDMVYIDDILLAGADITDVSTLKNELGNLFGINDFS
jgi:hypothetical protein